MPNGPQVGHATITNTDITDYRAVGVVALTSGSTLTITKSNIIGFDNSNLVGQTGILVDRGAKGIVTHNKISDNICKEEVPGCGPNWINDIQGFGISFGDTEIGSIISNNYVSNNDVGIGVFGASGCCIIDHNKLTDNLIFSIVVGDSEHTISNTKIFGGGVGVLAAATIANTIATLDHVKIIDAETPIQALSTGDLTATVDVVSPYFLAP
ncbi:MAG TPA: right-handed parallel beta-helix repeat-containing protein [Nitrososphaeraceae archaeon]|nr:right-handed parallel beta-helix repeat-containing protein [Nitrososphaeraceae archaeon]